VIYAGPNDASNVPPEWHGWLHGSFDAVPESRLPPARIWEADHTPNATGTGAAYRPQGALERGGRRAAASGDYEAWSPDA
jgi:NADH:ubiquinone oxidoreductase subunit